MDYVDNLEDLHADFSKSKIDISDIGNPLDTFKLWHKMAHDKNCGEPDFMILSTVSLENKPSARGVYLRDVTNGTFIFYTNYQSKKGEEMAANSNVALTFFWRELEKQIRIEGVCEKVNSAVSDAYFASRPKKSQLGAWASAQSREIDSREKLEAIHQEYAEKFPNEVPRPPHWGGYQVTPNYFEFWQGRPGRLHDRVCCELKNGEWKKYRIAP